MSQPDPTDDASQPGNPSPDTLDRIDSAVMLLTADGRVAYANAPMTALLGRHHDGVTGEQAETLLPATASLLGRALATALATRARSSSFGWDAYLRCWLGIRIFPTAAGIEAHVRLVPSSDHPASYDPGTTATDVVVPLDSLAIPMVIVDAEGILRHANQAMIDLLGYDRDALTDRPLAELFVHPALAHDLLGRLHQGETPQDHEADLWHRDRQIRTVLLTASPQGEDAPEGYTQCYLRDITAQREVEERDARLAAIVQASDDAIIATRLDGIITNWNPAAERLYGYNAEEAIGQPVTLIIPDHFEDEFPGIMSRLARGEHIDHYETIRQDKSGRRIDVSISIAPIRSRTGRIIGASTIARDITERRVLEGKQREFLMMVAHDLRSPLTSIKGFAQLMQRRETYSPAGISAILSQVRRMERLVGDVLEITRLDENRQNLELAETDLIALARSVIDRAEQLGHAGAISLISPEEPMVGMWDEGRLGQVLDNLLSNAIKYAPDGDIEIALRGEADHAEVVVQDQGPGIAAESLPHIFERFYRAPGEHTVGRGVGLGLAITRALVEAHGGTITVESEVGVGTRFVVKLPWDTTRRASDQD